MLRYQTRDHELSVNKNDDATYTLSMRERDNDQNLTITSVALHRLQLISVLAAFKSYVEN